MRRFIAQPYAFVHSIVAEAIKRSPIPARVFGPAKGVEPDMKEWIERRGDLPEASFTKVSDGSHFVWKRPRVIGPTLAEIDHEQDVQLPPSFVGKIPKARIVIEKGLVISPDDLIFEQSCCWGKGFIAADREFNSVLRPLKTERLSGAYAIIGSRMWTNYFHWVTESLTRLCMLESVAQVPILLPSELTSWHTEMLRMMGISEDRVVPLLDGCYEVDTLYFPSFPGKMGLFERWALQGVRDRLCRKEKDGPKKIYIPRGGTRHRSVVNEDEVIRMLAAEGFVTANVFTLREQDKRKLFGNADVIVGFHGSGLTNVVYAPQGARLLEILDPCHPVFCYYNLSLALEQEYYCMFGENMSLVNGTDVRKGYDNCRISLDSLQHAVKTFKG